MSQNLVVGVKKIPVGFPCLNIPHSNTGQIWTRVVYYFEFILISLLSRSSKNLY